MQAFNGESYYLVEVVAFILRYLKDQLLAHLHVSRGAQFSSTDFEWVIAIPAIWNAEAKQMMREAAYMVSYSYNHLSRSHAICIGLGGWSYLLTKFIYKEWQYYWLTKCIQEQCKDGCIWNIYILVLVPAAVFQSIYSAWAYLGAEITTLAAACIFYRLFTSCYSVLNWHHLSRAVLWLFSYFNSRWKAVCCRQLTFHWSLSRWQWQSRLANHTITHEPSLKSKI